MKTEQLYFLEDVHKYFGVDSCLEYKPVSTVAKILEPYTDWEAIKKYKARSLGISVEALEEDWSYRALMGTTAGTALHNRMERELLSEFIVEAYGTEFAPVQYPMDGEKKLQITELCRGYVYPELICSLHKDHVRIGGTSDIVYITDSGYVIIEDFKTDKAIEYEGYKGKMMAEPLQDLPCSNYFMYSVKMSLYMYFILSANPHLRPGDIIIRYVPIEREDGVPVLYDGEPKVLQEEYIDVDYQKMEPYVKKLLNHYYKTTKPQ